MESCGSECEARPCTLNSDDSRGVPNNAVRVPEVVGRIEEDGHEPNAAHVDVDEVGGDGDVEDEGCWTGLPWLSK